MTSTASTEVLRGRLVDELVDHGVIVSPWVRAAFSEMPREVFVPRFHRPYPSKGLVDGADPDQRDAWLGEVYTDQVLVVQYTAAPDMAGLGAPTSSSSQPSVMAGMLEALDLQPHHRVLEIGAGTGWNAALLCHRVGSDNVTTIELDPALAEAARESLASLGLHPDVRVGNGAAELPDTGPFDRIIATAATDHIPPAWINQLAPGGAILADLRGSLAGSLVRLAATDTDGEVETVEGRFVDLPGAFMPMRTRTNRPHRDGEQWDKLVYDHRNPQRTMTDVNPELVADDASLRFLIQLHIAGRRVRGLCRPLPGGDAALGGSGSDSSWFDVGLQPDDDGRFPVAQGGPQRLWDTVEAAHASWRRLGEPAIDRFGVTAHDDPGQQFVWWDHPDSGYRWPLPL